jgi:hypothetical protein
MLKKNDLSDMAGVSSPSGTQLPLNAGEQRRRFIKGGLAGGGVVMSLASRQVLAQTGVCKTASGFTSLAASGPRTSQFVCQGRTPGYWGQSQHPWPAPYKTGRETSNHVWDSSHNATPFDGTFGGSKYPGKTMMQVIWLGGTGDPYQIGAHFVAALLNQAAGITTVLSASQIKAMWLQYATNGSYQVVPGVYWTPSQIVDYLKSTMPL